MFAIHGNHDDPAGKGNLAALDILASANLVNYFGKCNNLDDIRVYPLLIEKGTTKVAIFGMGNIRDERLHRTFKQQKVRLMRPEESPNDWFNIFVLHQNRVAHGPKNYIPDTMIDKFLDLVIWGHEHDCQITPTPSTAQTFHISQPGSSIATALADGESIKK
jgi:double-strand break repair protein MRE11